MKATTQSPTELGNAVRKTARRYATGVTVIAVEHDGGIHAITANSFITLSLQPPLVGSQ